MEILIEVFDGSSGTVLQPKRETAGAAEAGNGGWTKGKCDGLRNLPEKLMVNVCEDLS